MTSRRSRLALLAAVAVRCGRSNDDEACPTIAAFGSCCSPCVCCSLPPFALWSPYALLFAADLCLPRPVSSHASHQFFQVLFPPARVHGRSVHPS